MWKDYSSGYIKNNRASGISVMAASFIAALFLSWLCGLFYHFWLDNIEAAKQEFGGGWQGRIEGELSAEDLLTVNQYPNVEQRCGYGLVPLAKKPLALSILRVYTHGMFTMH